MLLEVDFHAVHRKLVEMSEFREISVIYSAYILEWTGISKKQETYRAVHQISLRMCKLN